MELGGPDEDDSGHGGERGHQPGHRSARVLVCDDTEQIRRLIRVNLELDGFEVVEAVDGPEALEMLRDLSQPLPDVITLDVVMPRRDGWWMVSTIRVRVSKGEDAGGGPFTAGAPREEQPERQSTRSKERKGRIPMV